MWSELINASQQEFTNEAAEVKARLERSQGPQKPESVMLDLVSARSAIGSRARNADVAVVGRPAGVTAETAHLLVEGVLFHSGRPVLVVPPNWKKRPIGRRVLVCWKPTREAAHAIGDADDILLNAAKVTLLTVDADPLGKSQDRAPGADICAHLTRRGVTVDRTNISSAGRGETNAILEKALAVDADLIVMGGYGHSRLGEFVFGGVTRDMLRTSAIPLLMAH
jgi:nucleotide-binding universal stress UspA family protein